MDPLVCRFNRSSDGPGKVTVTLGATTLPPVLVRSELPGMEYIRVFDLAHAAVLGWSPNVVAALHGPLSNLRGKPGGIPIEEAINAVTFGRTLAFPNLTSSIALDDDIVRSIVLLASRSDDGPTDREDWVGCLDQGLEAFMAVRDRSVESLVLDLDKGQLVTRP